MAWYDCIMSQIKKFQKSFKDRVQEVVKKIPKGKVLTYGEVALRAGAKGASRAVGSIMSHNDDKNIPCHRVVRSDGKVGDYNGIRGKSTGSNGKMILLKKEGIKFTKSNKIIF
jgi:O-6-methylguanine DNA methyltransferase